MTYRDSLIAQRIIRPDTRDPGLAGKLVMFLVVGGSGVVVNSVALVVLYEYLRLPLVAASALAVETAIASNFLLNDRWTFGRRRLSIHRFGKFNAVSLGGLVITTTTLWLLVNLFNMPYLLANLLGISLSTAWNFIVNVLWTWGQSV